MTTITRRLEIDVGHRLLKHESKCRNLHGHRYVIELTVAARHGLDEVGRVIDFGKVKELVGSWLDREWDHGFLVQEGDPLIPWLVEHEMKHRVLGCPPTAENMVELAFNAACHLLVDLGITVVSVRLYETPNCWADYPGVGQ